MFLHEICSISALLLVFAWFTQTPIAQVNSSDAPKTPFVTASPSASVVGDFNGDGKPDLALLNSKSPNLENVGTVDILFGKGDGTFSGSKSFMVRNTPVALATGDFNRDGKMDLVVVAVDGTADVLLGEGNGTFRVATGFNIGQEPSSITAADFNGDGQMDLAIHTVGSASVMVFLGNGDGTFHSRVDSQAAWNKPSDTCPLPAVLHDLSVRVQDLVASLHKFSARERIEYAELDKNGRPHITETGVFDYVVQINQYANEQFRIEEYRSRIKPTSETSMRLVDTGTAAFALIFHPFYISGFTVSCEGPSDLKTIPVWELNFAQYSTRNNFHGFTVLDTFYPIKLEGKAWVATDTNNILRVETDLVEPIKEIRLAQEHSVIEYGPVEFRKHDTWLWLPQTAELDLDYHGRRYRLRHTFSDFKLFSVETEQQIKEPKETN